MLDIAERELQRRGKIKARDVVGVVAGTRLASGSTNFMRLHVVDETSGTTERSKRRTSR